MAETMTRVIDGEEVIEAQKATVSYEYVVPHEVRYGKGTFGSAKLGVFLPVDLTRETVAEVVAQAKRHVLEGLGVDYELRYEDDGEERVTDLLMEAFPGAVAVEHVPDMQTYAASTAPAPRFEVIKPLNDDHPDWLVAEFDRLVNKGDIDPDDNKLWDNRKFLPKFGGKGNAKGPWYKTKGGVAIWPPRNA